MNNYCSIPDIDYKAECEKQKQEIIHLKNEIEYLRELANEAHIMRTQLDIVYLIFGNK